MGTESEDTAPEVTEDGSADAQPSDGGDILGRYSEAGIDLAKMDPGDVQRALSFHREWSSKNPVPQESVRTHAEQLIHSWLSNPKTRDIVLSHYGQQRREQQPGEQGDPKVAAIERGLQELRQAIESIQTTTAGAYYESQAKAQVDNAEKEFLSAVAQTPGASRIPQQIMSQLFWSACASRGGTMSPVETRKWVKGVVSQINGMAAPRSAGRPMSSGSSMETRIDESKLNGDNAVAMLAEQLGLPRS